MKNKILFITNQAPRYRIPFFNKLANKTNIRLVFTNEDKKINGLNTDYILSRGFGWKKYKIHFGLKKILDQEKPLKVIMLPPDPLHLIDNLILYNYCKKKKIPFIFWTERWDYFNLSLKDKISNLFHSKMMRKANKIIVSGKKSFDWVKSLDIRETKIVTAPNASEIEFNKEDTKKRKKELIKQFDLTKEEAKRIKTSVELSGNPRCIMIFASIDEASEIDKARWDGLEGKIRLRKRK